MRYDLNALFYEKTGDRKPRYNVPMGLTVPDSFDYFTRKGFVESGKGAPGYLDYIKRDVSEEDLQYLTQEGFVEEMLAVLGSGTQFGRIDIEASEVDVIDDKGTVPPRGFFMSGVFVMLGGTDYGSPVWFIEGDPYRVTEKTRTAKIHMGALSSWFKVLTQNEVAGKIRRMRKDRWHNFDELEEWLGKVLAAEPKSVKLDSTVLASIHGEYLEIRELEMRSDDPDDDRVILVGLDTIKEFLGMEQDYQVLRWFAANYFEGEVFNNIRDDLEAQGVNITWW